MESHEQSKSFTHQELQQYDGDWQPEIYIAYKGVVYDVTDCNKWRTGLHEGLHFGGQDLTSELEEAPHFEEVFNHGCIKIVGKLKGGT